LAPKAFGVTSATGSDWKAIWLPSGDHAGSDPNSVSWRAAPPRAGTIQRPPRRIEWKAMNWPSGDHAGCTFCWPSEVSAFSEAPAACARTKISNAPERSEA
jgi:hypothetical protein